MTIAPAAGADIATVGGIVSGLFTVTETPADVAVLAAASRATAVTVWLPLLAPVLFHEIVYGRRRDFGAEVRAIELELDAGDAGVVRRCRASR